MDLAIVTILPGAMPMTARTPKAANARCLQILQLQREGKLEAVILYRNGIVIPSLASLTHLICHKILLPVESGSLRPRSIGSGEGKKACLLLQSSTMHLAKVSCLAIVNSLSTQRATPDIVPHKKQTPKISENGHYSTCLR
jgi:hypothetical protein